MTGMTFFAITLGALFIVAYQLVNQQKRVALVPIKIDEREEQR